MTNEIICPECPGVYTPDKIIATFGDEVTTLAALNSLGSGRDISPTADQTFWSRLSSRTRMPSPLSQQSLVGRLARLRAWTFTCPMDHEVDGNRGASLPIAVVGESGASKSHFLPAIIWELHHQRTLAPLGITLREALYTKVGLADAVKNVYERHTVLPATPVGRLFGPYGYRLAVRTDEVEDRYSFLLFDVAGEAFSSIIKIAENAKFILLCRGIIVLLDPVGMLPTDFDESPLDRRTRVITSTRVSKGISRVADTLEEVFDTSSRNLAIPVCFVISKADSIHWQYAWNEQTANVVASAPSTGIAQTLLASSAEVRDAYVNVGGDLVVQEIADRFDPRWTRFAAASATCEMPQYSDGEGRWVNPTSAGCGLAVLQILALTGVAISPGKPGRR